MFNISRFKDKFNTFKRYQAQINHRSTLPTMSGDDLEMWTIDPQFIQVDLQEKGGKLENKATGIVLDYDTTIYVNTNANVKEKDVIICNNFMYIVNGIANRDSNKILYCNKQKEDSND